MAQQYTAQDVMHVPVPKISARESFSRALVMLLRHDVGCVLVPPEGNSREYSIVTKHDLLSRLNSRRRDPWHLRVADIMTSPIQNVSADTLLSVCARLMVDNEISNLPVFGDNRPVGVLGAAQVFGALEERGWGSEVSPVLRRATRARVARRLQPFVPNPEAMVDAILADLER